MANSIFPWFRDSGVVSASPSAVLTVSTTSAQTGADTNETDLWTYSLPANTLDVNGRSLRITAWGDYGATANNKTVHLYFGTTTLTSATALANNGTGWVANGFVVRTGAATQSGKAVLLTTSGTVSPTTRTPTETLSGAVTIKITGTNGTAAAGDIVFKGALVELLN